jgi:hypothetical protein
MSANSIQTLLSHRADSDAFMWTLRIWSSIAAKFPPSAVNPFPHSYLSAPPQVHCHSFYIGGFVSLTGHASGRRVRKLRNISISTHIGTRDLLHKSYTQRRARRACIQQNVLHSGRPNAVPYMWNIANASRPTTQHSYWRAFGFLYPGLFSHGRSIKPLGPGFSLVFTYHGTLLLLLGHAAIFLLKLIFIYKFTLLLWNLSVLLTSKSQPVFSAIISSTERFSENIWHEICILIFSTICIWKFFLIFGRI